MRGARPGSDPGQVEHGSAAYHERLTGRWGIHNNSETAIHKIALSLDPIGPVVDSVVWIQWR